MNVNSRPSIAPSLATVASANEEEEEEEAADDAALQEEKEQELVQNINDKVEQISIRKCYCLFFINISAVLFFPKVTVN